MKPSPTLQDIADACRVTKTTVSLALRNHPRISRQTRERVTATARQMGYRLNPLVSAHMAHLRGTRKPGYQATLGFISNWPGRAVAEHGTHINRYFSGARARAEDLGYVLESFSLTDLKMSPQRLDGVLAARGITGLIIAPLASASGRLDLDWSRYAAVALGYSLREPMLDRACHNNYATILHALRQAEEMGYRRVGLAMAPEDDIRVRNLWLAGYSVFQHEKRALRALPPCLPEEWNKDSFLQWFRTHGPDLVISSSSQPLDWLRGAKVKIPGEVGCLTVAARGEVVSGFDQNFELIGATAVEKVTALLQRHEIGLPENPRIVLTEGSWIPGKTIRARAVAPGAATDAAS